MFRNPHFDLETELAAILSQTDDLATIFEDTIQWIIGGGNDTEELFSQIRLKLLTLSGITVTEPVVTIATWCCAEALSQSPKWTTWQIVKMLDNSLDLKNLHLSITVIIDEDFTKKENFIQLAKEILIKIDGLFLQDITEENQNTHLMQDKRFWISQEKPLEAIWRGIDRHTRSSYWPESAWFNLLITYDKEQAGAVLLELKNPFLAQQLISRAINNKEVTQENWVYFVQKPSLAFSEDAQWNGNFLIPLMLVEIRNQLLHHKANYDTTSEEQQRIKQLIEKTAEKSIQALSERKDALSLLTRWSAWLMYSLLIEGGDKTEDVRSSAFIDATLLTKIGNICGLKMLPLLVDQPNDLMSWEHWCNLATLSFWSQNGVAIDVPYQCFLSEWNLSADDWYTDNGQQLRDHGYHLANNDGQTRFPSDLAYLIAYPMAQNDEGINDWMSAWKSAFYLREIVEFSDENKQYEACSKAGELLFFLWQVGFALFDIKAQQCKNSQSETARSLANFFKYLNSTLQEILIIVDTLIREKWEQMVELLAIRRLIWEIPINNEQREYCIFLETDEPSFDEYLSSVKSDDIKLIHLLSSAKINVDDPDRVIFYTRQAGIDIEKLISNAERLNAVNSRHYPLNQEAICELRSMEVTQV